jgi:hypothetical protein
MGPAGPDGATGATGPAGSLENSVGVLAFNYGNLQRLDNTNIKRYQPFPATNDQLTTFAFTTVDPIPVQLTCAIPVDLDTTRPLEVDIMFFVDGTVASGTGVTLELAYSSTVANGLAISPTQVTSATVANVQNAAAGEVTVYRAIFCCDSSFLTAGQFLYLSFRRTDNDFQGVIGFNACSLYYNKIITGTVCG